MSPAPAPDVIEVFVETVTTVEVITAGPQGPKGDDGDTGDGTGSLPPLDPSPAGSFRTPKLEINERGQTTKATRNDNIATRNEAMLLLAALRRIASNVADISVGGVSGGLRT